MRIPTTTARIRCIPSILHQSHYLLLLLSYSLAVLAQVPNELVDFGSEFWEIGGSAILGKRAAIPVMEGSSIMKDTTTEATGKDAKPTATLRKALAATTTSSSQSALRSNSSISSTSNSTATGRSTRTQSSTLISAKFTSASASSSRKSTSTRTVTSATTSVRSARASTSSHLSSTSPSSSPPARTTKHLALSPTTSLSSTPDSTSTSISSASASSRSPSKTATSTPTPTLSSYQNSLPCVDPPTSFSPSFSTVCSVRYCHPPPAEDVAWTTPLSQLSKNPPVSRKEVETALGLLGSIEPVLVTGTNGNILSDGPFGQGAYHAGLLMEITGDIRALDIMLRMADNILALRNNPDTGRIIWTGNREPVWPTSPGPPNNVSVLTYAGSEQGDILGHMVNPAVHILKMPCLWSMVPPFFEGPSVFGKNETYLTRALELVRAGDQTVQDYFIPHFLDDSLGLIQPNDTRWNLVGDKGNHPGAPMPWNRRMLMLHGIYRLAAAHETVPAFDPATVWRYDQIIQANVGAFLDSLRPSKSAFGTDTFIWDYVALKNATEESRGVHGFYDIWGTWFAYQRNPQMFGVKNTIAMGLVNTFQDVVNLHNNSFSGLVSGVSIPGAMGVDALNGAWTYYAMWRPEWFSTVVNATLEHGFDGSSGLSVPLLWTKHAFHLDDPAFWSGIVASGYGSIPSVPSTTITLADVMKLKMSNQTFVSNTNPDVVTKKAKVKAWKGNWFFWEDSI